MRIGYAVGNKELIRCLNNVKYSFNSYTLNRIALVCGAEAVKDRAYFEQNIRKIVQTREEAKNHLTKLGFCFPDSRANFIFASHPEYDAGRLFKELRKADIYVRHWESDRIRQYLRITVGTEEEMRILFDFLEHYIK